MHWDHKPTNIGDKRVRRIFAWKPIILSSNNGDRYVTVWLQSIWIIQQLEGVCGREIWFRIYWTLDKKDLESHLL